jgi:hypothetical protein
MCMIVIRVVAQAVRVTTHDTMHMHECDAWCSGCPSVGAVHTLLLLGNRSSYLPAVLLCSPSLQVAVSGLPVPTNWSYVPLSSHMDTAGWLQRPYSLPEATRCRLPEQQYLQHSYHLLLAASVCKWFGSWEASALQ